MQRILLAVAFAFLAISGAAVAEETPTEGQERLLWEQATRENTPQFYGDYLRFYPRGKHAAEARRRLHGNPPPRAAAKNVDIGDLGGVALGAWRSMRRRSTMPCWRCYA